MNNDCNPATADGSGESWYNTPCDGSDTDLCNEGAWTCSGGSKTCSDTTGNTAEVCTGGLDEDCDGAIDCNDSNCPPCPGETACFDSIDNDSDGKIDCADPDCAGKTDGPCDGSDTDLCPEGVWTCSGGSKICSDTTGNNVEVCDNTDNDCKPATPDGSGESWYGSPTTCGVGVCKRSGQLTCSGGSEVDTCSPGSPTQSLETSCADGKDNDCDGLTDGSDSDCGGAACPPTGCAVGGIIFPVNKFLMISP